MLLMRCFLWLILCRKCIDAVTSTGRSKRGIRNNSDRTATNCDRFVSLKVNLSVACRCANVNIAPIYMSSRNNSFTICKQGDEHGCKSGGNETYLVVPSIHVDNPVTGTDCDQIIRVFVWELLSSRDQGVWTDVSEMLNQYFHVKDNAIVIQGNINYNLWSGHVIRINYGCARRHCLITKFKGDLLYKYEYQRFKNSVVNGYLDDDDADNSLSITTIVIIIVASLVVTMILILLYIFRRKLPCQRYTMRKRESTAGSTRSTDRVIQVRCAENALTLNDPWYQIHKLSSQEDYSQFVGENDNDSFYIPTLKGFSRERNSRNRNNLSDLKFSETSLSRENAQPNPYNDSAS